MKLSYFSASLISSLVLCACDSTQSSNEPTTNVLVTGQSDESASVTAVSVTGASGSYKFGVTIESPDAGCDQYADWWEVIRSDGSLVYRRILALSHVCLLYTSPSPRDQRGSRMPSSA